GETPPPRLVACLLAGQEGIERNRRHLGPDAAGRAKIGNAALGGDAGAGEWHDRLAGLDEIAQPGDGRLQIGGDHVWSGILRYCEVAPCDICTRCCACAISTTRSTSIATSSASRRSAGGSTKRTSTRWCSWPRRKTRAWSRRASAAGAKPRWSSSP